ncbi:PREDICTED: glomulin-like [Cyprinodon variegatus]|uniref:glomulin-like n=1 Tax=Cyprinodon variegatus TaxID=28743 RepID=UPI0007425183|nr:PREDICTED: glomulin-like [Cyprinodon variegatus]
MMNEDKVYEIIRRWRNTPEEDLKPEDFQQFRDIGAACLRGGDSKQLLKFVQDEKNQICSSESLVESFIGLIEDMDPGAISETILAVLPHLQTVLFQLEENRAACLGLTLSALQQQLSRLPVPFTLQQEEADEHGLCHCCIALAMFAKAFIDDLKRKEENCHPTAEEEAMKAEILKFCMRSLKEPLLEAELNQNKKSTLWLFAAEIMVSLPAIKEPIPGLLLFSSLKKFPMIDTSLSKESLACLAYLLFVQLITIDMFPAVFSPVFILQCNMDHINQLLSSKKESHLLKGLALFSKSLEKVEDDSLPVGLLDLKSFYNAPQNLRRVLTDCPFQHLRESGLKIFQLFINKLDVEAKHKFFRCMLKTSHHAGVEGYIVKNIRNQVHLSIKADANRWFLGAELLPLLDLVLSLPQGAETDLLANMDRMMESLNLLRYLLMQDKELRRNANMWEDFCRIKDDYLRMLRVSISMSRAYYSAEMKALKEDQRLKAKEAKEKAKSTRLLRPITVKHDKLPHMSPEIQHQVLQSALVTFDLMESLIVRIDEITEEKLEELH